jgi:thiamine pyrophosphokinase
MTQVVIFANGIIQAGPLVDERLAALRIAGDLTVIAADGGLRAAVAWEFQPSVVIGDMDSLAADELAALEVAPDVRVLRYPAEKDETDLELALLWAAHQVTDIESITLFGALGGRVDQTLANLYLLALPDLARFPIFIVDGAQEIRLLRPGAHTLDGLTGDTVSLIPLGGAATGIHTDGLYYPLRGEALHFGPARGVSNVMTGPTALIRLDAGLLLCIHTRGRA